MAKIQPGHIRITRSTAVRGKYVKPDDVLTVGKDISISDARLLLRGNKALPEDGTRNDEGGETSSDDKPISKKTKAELIAYAEEHSIEIDKEAKVDEIRAVIVEAKGDE